MALFNYAVLTAGFDAPRTRCAIIARPTKSLVLYSQMVGRAMRGTRSGGNKSCEIYTVVDTALPGFGSVVEAFSHWAGDMAEQLKYGDDGDSLFIPADTLKAMRDSRYRNTAYALAELIDNSIDAKAKHIDIICYEQQEPVQIRVRWRLQEIGVLDNGYGMSKETLVQALRFGGRQPGGIRRIGKYGMGLPTASVSTCRRVDVWTWQDGIDNSWHSYIDVDSIEQNVVDSVPEPDRQLPPVWYMQRSTDPDLYGKHGTLIIWKDLDRVTEKADTIFNRIEREIGKIYRYSSLMMVM